MLHSDESIQRIFGEHVAKDQLQKMEFPTTFLTQFLVLSRRMFVQTKRNLVSLLHRAECDSQKLHNNKTKSVGPLLLIT